MFTLIAFAGLLVLLWIAFRLGRVLTLLDQQAVARVKESIIPNSEYPAFTRSHVERVYEYLQEIANESTPLEKELFDSPGWKTVGRGRAITDEERDLMGEICLANVQWEHTQRQLHFAVEANQRVRKGHWSIAQAKYYYQGLGEFSFAMVSEAEKRATEWATGREANDKIAQEKELREYKEKMKPFEAERDQYLKQWKDHHAATANSKPSYFSWSSIRSSAERF